MAEFRIILLKSSVQLAPVTTSILPAASPIFALTFTTERKEIFPKLLTYHEMKKKLKIQPWYLQIRVKFQMDFNHLSERNRFFYIDNKLKNKFWIKCKQRLKQWRNGKLCYDLGSNGKLSRKRWPQGCFNDVPGRVCSQIWQFWTSHYIYIYIVTSQINSLLF